MKRTCTMFFSFILFAASSATAATAQDKTAIESKARIEAATWPLGFPGSNQQRLSLAGWMDLMHVPAISVAVIDDYKIVWTAEYGFADVEHRQQVTSQTVFQAGSVSKALNAFGILRLVQSGQLSLDEDVNQKLKSWKVPEDEFTRQGKVTLRRILSHTAGFTVHGFNGYTRLPRGRISCRF